ncbi:MAG: hypothetical protein R2845_14155 [Thermomicrobiales bacterium]
MSSDQDREGSENREPLEYSGRSGLIYCGLCGALNPSSNHYCARCGSTLVDAFHATEGLRVFSFRISRIVQIVSSGTSLEVLPDDDAPADYARIRLGSGRLEDLHVKPPDVIGSKAEAPSAVSPRHIYGHQHQRAWCVTGAIRLRSRRRGRAIGALLPHPASLRAEAISAASLLLVYCINVVR